MATHVYLLSENGNVRVPLLTLALWYVRKKGFAVDEKSIQWAKSKLLSFGCEPCEKCEFTGQKTVKSLGRLRLTLKSGTAVSRGHEIVKLQEDKQLEETEYFLQAPSAVRVSGKQTVA